MSATTRVTSLTRFDRMIAKSEEQTRAGNLPRLLRTLPAQPDGLPHQVWAVGSRTTAGEIHIIEVTHAPDGGDPTVACDCPATTGCWHRAHVLRALNGEVPFYRTPERPFILTERLERSLLAGDDAPAAGGPGIGDMRQIA